MIEVSVSGSRVSGAGRRERCRAHSSGLVRVVACAVLATALLVSVPCARAQSDEAEDLTDKVASLVSDLLTRESFIIPVIISNPTVGSGFGLAAARFYQLDAESLVSSSSLGAYYTFNESWLVAARQETYFGEGRHRLNGLFGVYSLNTDYYGIGYDAGSEGSSVPTTKRGVALEAEYFRRIRSDLYGGLAYRFIRMDTTQDDGPVSIPEGQESVTSSGLGAGLSFDSRDNQYGPRTGVLFNLGGYIMRTGLGSDSDYDVFELECDTYVNVGESTVLAFRAMGRFSAGDVPFFDLSRYGSGSDLRGYIIGQYRDRLMYAIQAEGRFRIVGRLGGVAFAGIGGIAPTINEFHADELLPGVGAGLRFVISEELRISVGLDYAVGRDTDGWYARVGEAF